MKFLTQLFSEAPKNGQACGKPSSTKVLTFLIVLTVLGLWIFATIKHTEMAKITPEEVMLIAAAMGIKVWQRGKEGDPKAPETKV